MKNILSILLLSLFACSAGAQKIVEKQVELTPGATVKLNIQIADSIRIITWNKNTAYVKTAVNINDNQNNDNYKFTFDGSGDQFEMKTKLEFEKGSKYNNCNCSCKSEVFCEVYVPENTNVTVETINGNITLSGKIAAVHAKSISGFVDMAVSPQRKAYVKLSTITGTMYSDLDFSSESKDLKHVGGNRVSQSLNGGGDPIDLETISGNIYLRKG